LPGDNPSRHERERQRIGGCILRITISQLPFSLRLDSDDLYVPTLQERETFFKWLENDVYLAANPSRSATMAIQIRDDRQMRALMGLLQKQFDALLY
jgi:hypothetical protein